MGRAAVIGGVRDLGNNARYLRIGLSGIPATYRDSTSRWAVTEYPFDPAREKVVAGTTVPGSGYAIAWGKPTIGRYDIIFTDNTSINNYLSAGAVEAVNGKLAVVLYFTAPLRQGIALSLDLFIREKREDEE